MLKAQGIAILGMGGSLGLREIIVLCEKILPFYLFIFLKLDSLFVAKYTRKRLFGLFAQCFNTL